LISGFSCTVCGLSSSFPAVGSIWKAAVNTGSLTQSCELADGAGPRLGNWPSSTQGKTYSCIDCSRAGTHNLPRDHIIDVLADPEHMMVEARKRAGFRTLLAVADQTCSAFRRACGYGSRVVSVGRRR